MNPEPISAERGRYHLYMSHACPYSARAVLVRCVQQLQDVVSMSALDPVRGPEGWVFGSGEHADPLNGFRLLREAYEATDANYEGRASVPVLWDRQTRRIADMPHLTRYTREIYQLPGIAATVRHDEILLHYYRSFPALNPLGIVPLLEPSDFGREL
jgi:glutathionyl-hydroquinone reductase